MSVSRLKRRNNVRVGSLFSGIGGIELGFEQAGEYETIWCIEKELYAQAILRKHFPNATIYDDVTTVDFKQLPPIDIITGGFPCQDISNAGKRTGITGSRSSLWKYCCKALSICRPRLAVFENVSALTQRGLDTVLCDLAQIGYDAEWYCIPASAVGAPHRRDRIFILSYPHRSGFIYGQVEKFTTEEGKSTQCEFITISKDVAYTDCKRLERKYESKHRSWESKTSSGWGGQWSAEPELGRVAHGVPYRVDRIKCLGNAVVPTVAKAIAEAIKDRIKLEEEKE